MHGRRMWDRARIVQALAFIRRHGMTALVLHESDLVHQVVYPRTCFDPYAQWRDAPTRRGENAIFNNRIYFDHLLRLAARVGVEVWIETKEIGFSDEVLELRPELVKDGVVCPSEPFWDGYIEQKTEELLADFPLLSGMIVSMGSQESRASRAQNKCRCARCVAEPVVAWYGRIIDALYRPIRRHGKRLAIRDFAYKPADHAPLIQAVDRAPADIIFSIKAMPHDFYLTFPPNPAIGATRRTQWIEYDCFGQFFGWGLFPCLVDQDLRQRFAHAAAHGVTGGIFRSEWERINDLSAFDTLGEINLISAAALARGEAIDATEACRRWLGAHGHPEPAAAWLADVLTRSTEIIRRAAYMDGFVYADNSMLPRSIGRAWWGMESRDGLAMWNPARSGDLVLDRARVAALSEEKDRALAAARQLSRDVAAGDPALGADLAGWLRERFAHYVTWIEGLRATARVCLYARWFGTPGTPERPGDVDRLRFAQAIDALDAYAASIRPVAIAADVPHQLVMLIDHRRAEDVARDGRATLAALS
jgi:hypothetical protein